MSSSLMVYRALAFVAGSISAFAFATAIGLIGPKHKSHRPGSNGQVEVFGEAIVKDAPRSDPAPSAVARTSVPLLGGQPEGEALEASAEKRVSALRRESAKAHPAPDLRDVDAALARALEKRGLGPDDVDQIPSTARAHRRFLVAKQSGDAREIEAALQGLIQEVEGARISADLVRRKLDAIGEALKATPGLERFEARYLDLQNAVAEAADERALLGLLVRISTLGREVRAARRVATP